MASITAGCAAAALSEKNRIACGSQADRRSHGKPKVISSSAHSREMRVGQDHDVAAIMGGLYGDGIIGLKGAFTPEWADAMHEDIMTLFEEAKAVPGGALPRGPHRFYAEVHPERVRGFVDIATHPWFVAVCEAVLGPDYKIVEVGFDIPFPGAEDQPWHRDFPSPAATLKGRRLNSLAFNLSAVDTVPEMGPLQIAPGTQWDDFGGVDQPDRELAMFPP